MKNPDPLNVAHFIKDRLYPDAAVAFAAGSVFRGEGSAFSDIDLVVLYEDGFEDVRRESIKVQGWPVEVFIQNVQAQNYFFDKDRERGMPILMNMVAEGIEIPHACDLSLQQKDLAQRLIAQGPPPLKPEDKDFKRYAISDLLDDLRGVSKPDERYAILAKLYVDLADFHLRANGLWSGVGKGLPRALRRYAHDVADLYGRAFDLSYGQGDDAGLFDLANIILAPHGGALFDFKQKASPDWRAFQGICFQNVGGAQGPI